MTSFSLDPSSAHAKPSNTGADGYQPSLELQRSENGEVDLCLRGLWTTAHAGQIEHTLDEAIRNGKGTVCLDLAELQGLDTLGAWLIVRLERDLAAAGRSLTLTGARPGHQGLIDHVRRREDCPGMPPRRGAFRVAMERLGLSCHMSLRDFLALWRFVAEVFVVLLGLFRHPGRLRLTGLVNQIEKTGIDALPIVGMLTFLIGVVLSYMGAQQLARFGAQIFTVDLVAISVLREMGILITAIILAGRSGSAYTAQIGTMVVNEEIDAMRSIGLNPVEVLALPRILAMTIVLPLLTVYADVMGLFGGALMAVVQLDLTLIQFLRQLQDAVDSTTMLAGLIKAPVFGFVIAVVGCFEGLRTESRAEAVGSQTTRSVVKAISLVIMMDAIFVIVFSAVGI